MRERLVQPAILLESVVIMFVDAALDRSTDCAAAIAAPVSMNFEELEAGNRACGVALGGLVVDKLGLIGGLIGIGLAIPDAGLIT